MTRDGWRDVVRRAVGDPVLFDLLVDLLVEQDAAKHALRDKGYGCTGMGLARTVVEVPGDADRNP